MLFDKMLIFEKTQAKDLAYDRITPKMIKFLAKHFKLTSYIPQNSGFAVYSGFFNKKSTFSSIGENLCKVEI